MAMPLRLDSDWTAERWRALPDDGKRYEVLDGELWVTPSPTSRHNAVAEEFYDAMRPWARDAKLARVRYAPADIEFSERRVLQPDLYPSTARIDRLKKRRIYQEQGVPEYWLIDPDARLVERWRPRDERPEIPTGTLTWTPVPGGPTLSIDLPASFRTALGDD